MTAFPVRGQKAPDFWDDQLHAYIDEVVTSDRVSDALAQEPAASDLLALIEARAGSPSADADLAVRSIIALTTQHFDSVLSWAKANNVSLIVTETGGPQPENRPNEAARWRAVIGELLTYFARHDLRSYVWAARKYPRPDDVLEPYKASGGLTGVLDTALSQAYIAEHVPANARGVVCADGHDGFPTTQATGAAGGFFNNSSRGVFDVDYTYADADDFAYLVERGYETVRMTIRWERIQPTRSAALDTTELARITAAVDAAGAAGLLVQLALKNHGCYYTSVASVNTRNVLGTAGLTQAEFVDLWTRLSTAFKAHPYIYAYDLDNEPSVPTVADWHAASQAAVTAIRANLDTTLIVVQGGGQGFASAQWVQDNGPTGWITDSANNFVYGVVAYPYGLYQNGADYISIDTSGDEANAFLNITRRAIGTQQLTGAFQSCPIPPGPTSLISGSTYFIYFDAHLDMTITQLVGHVSSQAGVSLTLARMGLALVTTTAGSMRMLAETASAPTSWQSTFNTVTQSLSTARGGPSSVRIVKGSRYALILLITGASTMPFAAGHVYGITGMGSEAPVLSKRLQGQTDLPAIGATILAATLDATAGRPYLLAKP